MIKEITKMNYQDGRELNEAKLVKHMLKKYNIKEVTTQRQAKNGTREFEFPVPARRRYYHGKLMYSDERLRLACFTTGYVRNQNSCYSNYQLNPTYKRKKKWVFLGDNGTETRTYTTISRARIFSGLARLNYMLEFYLRNYNTNTNKAR